VRTVGIHEAKTRLSALLRDVEDGEEILITRGGRPVARVVAVDPPAQETPGQRGLGMFKGQMHLSEDFKADSDQLADLFGIAPLPDE